MWKARNSPKMCSRKLSRTLNLFAIGFDSSPVTPWIDSSVDSRCHQMASRTVTSNTPLSERIIVFSTPLRCPLLHDMPSASAKWVPHMKWYKFMWIHNLARVVFAGQRIKNMKKQHRNSFQHQGELEMFVWVRLWWKLELCTCQGAKCCSFCVVEV